MGASSSQDVAPTTKTPARPLWDTKKDDFVECWDVQHVQAWLRAQGLQQYNDLIDHFRVDGESLLSLANFLSAGDAELNCPFIVQAQAIESPDSFTRFRNAVDQLAQRYEAQLPHPTSPSTVFEPHLIPTVESPSDVENKTKVVLFYHQQTEHGKNHGSRSISRNWATQPRICRRYVGCDIVPLPTRSDISVPYERLYSPLAEHVPVGPSLATLADLLRFSLSVTGTRDAWQALTMPRAAVSKRVNASSGGLHPTEAYVLLPAAQGPLPTGTYHYVPRHHALERRANTVPEAMSSVEGVHTGDSPFFCLIAVTSVHWRETWKYGERGYRYCMMDAGHAVGAIRMSAARLGLCAQILPGITSDTIEAWTGVADANRLANAEEHEYGICMLAVYAPSMGSELVSLISNGRAEAPPSVWYGVPNKHSSLHYRWDIVHAVSEATRRDVHSLPCQPEPSCRVEYALAPGPRSSPSSEEIILARRSAVDFTNRSITVEQFVQVLWRAMPSHTHTPHDVMPWSARVHLFIMVYNVEGLQPGLYVLLRNEDARESLVRATSESFFAWQGVPSCVGLSLYLLKEMEQTDAASLSCEMSCTQNIAKNGAFSLGMVADLKGLIDHAGPCVYPHLHIEAGILGQQLYLEATSLGLGATGMGCFLDDLAEQTFGLRDKPEQAWKTLYHFAVGVPSRDDRYPPYNYTKTIFEDALEEVQ